MADNLFPGDELQMQSAEPIGFDKKPQVAFIPNPKDPKLNSVAVPVLNRLQLPEIEGWELDDYRKAAESLLPLDKRVDEIEKKYQAYINSGLNTPEQNQQSYNAEINSVYKTAEKILNRIKPVIKTVDQTKQEVKTEGVDEFDEFLNEAELLSKDNTLPVAYTDWLTKRKAEVENLRSRVTDIEGNFVALAPNETMVVRNPKGVFYANNTIIRPENYTGKLKTEEGLEYNVNEPFLEITSGEDGKVIGVKPVSAPVLLYKENQGANVYLPSKAERSITDEQAIDFENNSPDWMKKFLSYSSKDADKNGWTTVRDYRLNKMLMSNPELLKSMEAIIKEKPGTYNLESEADANGLMAEAIDRTASFYIKNAGDAGVEAFQKANAIEQSLVKEQKRFDNYLTTVKGPATIEKSKEVFDNWKKQKEQELQSIKGTDGYKAVNMYNYMSSIANRAPMSFKLIREKVAAEEGALTNSISENIGNTLGKSTFNTIVDIVDSSLKLLDFTSKITGAGYLLNKIPAFRDSKNNILKSADAYFKDERLRNDIGFASSKITAYSNGGKYSFGADFASVLQGVAEQVPPVLATAFISRGLGAGGLRVSKLAEEAGFATGMFLPYYAPNYNYAVSSGLDPEYAAPVYAFVATGLEYATEKLFLPDYKLIQSPVDIARALNFKKGVLETTMNSFAPLLKNRASTREVVGDMVGRIVKMAKDGGYKTAKNIAQEDIEEKVMALVTPALNFTTNQLTGAKLDDEFRVKDFINTIKITAPMTALLGLPSGMRTMIKGSTRTGAVIAMADEIGAAETMRVINEYEKNIGKPGFENVDTKFLKQIKTDLISYYTNKFPPDITTEQKILLAPLLSKKSELEKSMKGMDKSVAVVYQEKLKEVDEKISNIIRNPEEATVALKKMTEEVREVVNKQTEETPVVETPESQPVFIGETVRVEGAPEGTHLNVGLLVGRTNQQMTPEQITEKLPEGVTVVSQSVVNGSEPTLSLQISRPLTNQEMDKFLADTEQQAIPQLHNGEGVLFDKKRGTSEAWGEFNPEFFVKQDGQPLAKAEAPVQMNQTQPATATINTNIQQFESELETLPTEESIEVERQAEVQKASKPVLEMEYIPDSKLKGKQVNVVLENAETGESITTKQKASSVMASIRARAELLQKLNNCIG